MTPSPSELLDRAARAAARAYCPYSAFPVGACLLAADGRCFTAANVENASFGLTLCAERAAVACAIAAGARSFTALALVAGGAAPAYPCGACRQVLSEFCGPDLVVHLAAPKGMHAYETTTLGELLPKRFKLESGA